MSAHVQETEGTSAAMVDTAAAAESDRLGDALVELETDGIAYGDLALTIALHGPLEETESLDGDIRRIFASHDAKVIREGYGQLPAWFSRLPAQPRRRQVRSVFMSAGAAACLAPIFGPPVGTPTSGHLQQRALAILETQWRTPYHYDLFQRDVGHTLVLGATGAGKSFTLNFLLVQALQYDPRVLILDLGGSYRWLTRFLERGVHGTIPGRRPGWRQLPTPALCTPGGRANLSVPYRLDLPLAPHWRLATERRGPERNPRPDLRPLRIPGATAHLGGAGPISPREDVARDEPLAR